MTCRESPRRKPPTRPAVRPLPDFAELHKQRQSHPHVTQQLLWEEYRQANPDGYRYSRFCELYQRWRRKQDVVLRQRARAVEREQMAARLDQLAL